MDLQQGTRNRAEDIVAVFDEAFATSEGAAEGRIVAGLADDLMKTTAENDLFVFTAWDGNVPVGAIIFTRIFFADDPRAVFLLSPVAVATPAQGRGVGLALLRFGLDAVRKAGGDIAVTYGDPNYYSKVGFKIVGIDVMPAPHPLKHAHGWQAQVLGGGTLSPMKGTPRYSPVWDNPEHW